MDVGNKLYLIGIDYSLKELLNEISLYENEIEFGCFWDCIYFFEYNQNNKNWKIFDRDYNLIFACKEEKNLFSYMDKNKIRFIYNNPLGEIFKSFTMAYLECVRWAADTLYAKNRLELLLKE